MGVKTVEPKVCPMIQGQELEYCFREGCAWWIEGPNNSGHCAILYLGELARQLYRKGVEGHRK